MRQHLEWSSTRSASLEATAPNSDSAGSSTRPACAWRRHAASTAQRVRSPAWRCIRATWLCCCLQHHSSNTLRVYHTANVPYHGIDSSNLTYITCWYRYMYHFRRFFLGTYVLHMLHMCTHNSRRLQINSGV